MVGVFGLKRFAKRSLRNVRRWDERRRRDPRDHYHAHDAGEPTVDFQCNVCGVVNRQAPLKSVENRERQSCGSCHSSLRMRSVVHALSMELYAESLPIPDFPVDLDMRGMGMSDWDGYALRLALKMAYVNTFYHAQPRLDITDIPDALRGTQRFLISSDVFEHIPLSGLSQAFRNARDLLDDEGVFVFTVPYRKTGSTVENFPNLHEFKIEDVEGTPVLHNLTKGGDHEVFDRLIFHGGPGMTLEMRMFSEPDLMRDLKEAGFSSVRIYADVVPKYGILWPMDWAVPIVARR